MKIYLNFSHTKPSRIDQYEGEQSTLSGIYQHYENNHKGDTLEKTHKHTEVTYVKRLFIDENFYNTKDRTVKLVIIIQKREALHEISINGIEVEVDEPKNTVSMFMNLPHHVYIKESLINQNDLNEFKVRVHLK